jgi:flagellar hook-basal body complex protein FliE
VIDVIGTLPSLFPRVADSMRVSPESLMARSSPDFASVLKDGESAAIKGINGEMPVQEAVERILEAERALQTAVTVRDKIVAAYLEIARMQI